MDYRIEELGFECTVVGVKNLSLQRTPLPLSQNCGKSQ